MELESLQIQITSDAKTADAEIDSLVNRLTTLKTALGGFKTISFDCITKSVISANSSLTSFSNTITNLSQNLKIVDSNISILNKQLSGVRIDNSASTSIDAVTVSIRKLGGKQIASAISNLPKLATGLQMFTKEINGIGSLKFDTASLTSFVTALSRLGGKASTQAVVNLPRLTVELKNLMSELSKAPAVSDNLIRMTEALSRLARTGRASGTAATSLSNSFSLFGNRANFTKKSAFSIVTAFGKLYTAVWSLTRVFGFLKESIDISSSLTEVENVVRQTFGRYEYLINNFAKTSIEKYGMSELSAKTFASRFQAMGTALDIPQKQMAKMSVRLTALTGDMASFYDVAQEDVAKSLQSIFSGTTMPMRRYGVDLTQATLNEWLMKQGIDADVKSMSQAQKAMVRYQYTLQQTQMVTDDFQRTSTSWHNTLTVLHENFKELGKTVGTIAINAFKPFLRALNIVMQKVNSFIETVTSALGAIFGWKFEISNGGASDLADDLNDAYGHMDDLSESADSASDNTGQVAKNAKKAKKEIQQATRAFDELKTISKQNSNSSSGSGNSGGSGNGSVGQWVETPTKYEEFESSIKDLEGLGTAIRDALVNAVGGIEWDEVYAQASGFGTGLAEFLNGLFSADKKGNSVFTATADVIAGALNTAIFASKGFTKKFDFETFGKNVANGFNRFFKKFKWKQCAEAINGWVDGFWKAVKGFFSELSWKDIFDGLKTFLTNLSPTTITTIIGAKVFSKLGKNFYKLIKNSITKDLDTKLSSAITKKLSGVSLGAGIAGTLATGFLIAATITVAVQFSEDFKEWKDNIEKYGWNGGREKTARDNKANPYNNGRAITDQDIDDYVSNAKKRANTNKANPYNPASNYSKRYSELTDKNSANPYDPNSTRSKKTLEFQAKIKTKASDLWSKLKKDWDKIKDKFADFKARVKNDSKEWWSDVKKYWSEKVGKVKDFTTNVKNNAKDWWKNTKAWWNEKVGKVSEFTTGVKNKASDWWSNVKSWWSNAIDKKEVKKFTANVKKAGGTWWKDVSNEWKEKVINAGRTLKIGISFAKDALSNMWSSVTKFFGGKTVSVDTKATKKADGGVFSGGSWKPIKKYAVGGIPNMGQMFVAREAGPELVGTLGGHTAVMNNDQIVSSVSVGVAQAVKEVIQPLIRTSAGNNQPIQIVLDGKVIFDSTRQSAQEYFNRTGRSPYPV